MDPLPDYYYYQIILRSPDKCAYLKIIFYFSTKFCTFLGMEFSQVQMDVAEILKGRLLVGHALENDLKVFTIWASMQKNLSSGFLTK